MTAILELSSLSFAYGKGGFALEPVSMAIKPGGYVTIVGPNAAGKTTLLKLIGGFLPPGDGRVRVAGEDVTHCPPGQRSMCTVFQDSALIPHLSAAENVRLGLRARTVARSKPTVGADDLLEQFGIQRQHRDKRPAELSGGQRQRVALARALAVAPRILLLDEPLAAVDLPSRDDFEALLLTLRDDPDTAVVEVTHMQSHALAVSTEVAFFEGGRLRRLAPPEDIYRRPDDLSCAKFFGPNTFGGAVERAAGNASLFRSAAGFVSTVPDAPGCSDCRVLIRPEAFSFRPEPGALNSCAVTVESVAFRGVMWEYVCRADGGERVVVKELSCNAPQASGSVATIYWKTADVHVFS